jgi:outer membrane lipoprotein SlyB
MDSERSGVAPMAGAVLGGTVGSGRGSAVGAVVGTVAGEAAAQAGTRPALEITVRLDEGRVIAVTQPAGKESFKPGERVRVVSDGRAARVTR